MDESERASDPPKTHVSVAQLQLKIEHNNQNNHDNHNNHPLQSSPQQHEHQQPVQNGQTQQQLQSQTAIYDQQQQPVTKGQQLDQQQQEQRSQQQHNLTNGQALQIGNYPEFESKDVNIVTFSTEAPTSKLVPPRQRASMLPKPEVGPKPSYLRTPTGKRQLPLSSGPSSLNIMSTSLPSPFASSPSPSDSCDSSR